MTNKDLAKEAGALRDASIVIPFRNPPAGKRKSSVP
jgi:hypothetical protein